jgi:hypothetical protein
MTELASHRPQRRIGTSRRALTGRVALGDSQAVDFESSLERDWLEQLDFDPRVVELQVQPFSLEHEVEGRKRKYTPDVLAVWQHGSVRETIVYEVKFRDDLRNGWLDYRPRFVAATRYCRERGWRFKIMTERRIRTPMLSAVKFLRPYRRIEDHAVFRERLMAGLRDMGPTTVAQLLEATLDSKQERLQALPSLWKLVANFDVEVDFGKPLSMRTQVRSAT